MFMCVYFYVCMLRYQLHLFERLVTFIDRLYKSVNIEKWSRFSLLHFAIIRIVICLLNCQNEHETFFLMGGRYERV